MRFQLAIVLFLAAAVPYVLCGSAKAGEECSSASDCIANTVCSKVDDACSKGVCACSSGFGQTKAKACIKVVAFGETCADEIPCDGAKHLTCPAGKKCECAAGYKEDNKVCKTKMTQAYDAACDADKMCVSPYLCAGTKKCGCSNTKYTNAECKGVMKDGACESGKAGKECHTPYKLTCKSSKCECEADHVWGQYVNAAGKAETMCVHKDVTKNVKAGETCKVSNDNKGKLCMENYSCNLCQGDSDSKCRKNPEQTTAPKGSSTTIVINMFLISGATLLKMLV